MARLVSIHAPWEGCDTSALAVVHAIDVSIHAPWEGCDACSPRRFLRQIKFQFTHPGKGATKNTIQLRGRDEFQFTHPGKGATTTSELKKLLNSVSIHAPWEGCDIIVCQAWRHLALVSIHAPWEGCDVNISQTNATTIWFQFTHPGKGATYRCCIHLD